MSASAADLLYAVAAAGGLMALMAAAGFLADGWPQKIIKWFGRKFYSPARKRERPGTGRVQSIARQMADAAMAGKDNIVIELHGTDLYISVNSSRAAMLAVLESTVQDMASRTSVPDVISACIKGCSNAMREK